MTVNISETNIVSNVFIFKEVVDQHLYHGSSVETWSYTFSTVVQNSIINISLWIAHCTSVHLETWHFDNEKKEKP